MKVLGYDIQATRQAVGLVSHLETTGNRIGIFDELIASICLAHNAVLVTRNTKHFERIPGLRIENW